MPRIGFIGLGRMGLPMAGNLAKAGHEVIAFDTVGQQVQAAAVRGCKASQSAQDCARHVSALITMLPAGPDTLAVYETSGVLEAASPGTLFIDASSIDPASAIKAHELAAAAGMLSLEAPVSGGVAGAENAALTLMCGGSEEAFAKAKPILEGVGKRVIHCGGPGAGQGVKMCNQMMVATNIAIIAEAFALAEKLGISHKILHDVVTTSSGGSWALQNYVPVPDIVATSAANRDFAPGFTTELMLKDVNIYQDAARAAGMPSPVGSAAAALYQLFAQTGHLDKDYSGVIELLRGLGANRT